MTSNEYGCSCPSLEVGTLFGPAVHKQGYLLSYFVLENLNLRLLVNTDFSDLPQTHCGFETVPALWSPLHKY